MENKLYHVQWYYDDMQGLACVKLEDANLSIGKLAGKDMPVEILLPVLNATLPANWMEQAEELHQSRISSWTLAPRFGQSGCTDYRLYYLRNEDLLDQPKADEIHVSMYGKLNEGLSLWMGDLPPILAAILADYSPATAGSYSLQVYEPERKTGYREPGAPSGLREILESLQAMEVIGNE